MGDTGRHRSTHESGDGAHAAGTDHDQVRADPVGHTVTNAGAVGFVTVTFNATAATPLVGTPLAPVTFKTNGAPVPAALPILAPPRVFMMRSGVNGTDVADTVGGVGGGVVGGVAVTVTLTVSEVVAVKAAESVAVHVTVVAPTANWVPDAGTQLTVGVERRSCATGIGNDTVALLAPGAAAAVTSAGVEVKNGDRSNRINNTRFCPVGTGNTSFDVNSLPGANTCPGGVPITLFDDDTVADTPPAATPNVTAPTSATPPLSQNGLVTT
jgi:hypothetical protein